MKRLLTATAAVALVAGAALAQSTTPNTMPNTGTTQMTPSTTTPPATSSPPAASTTTPSASTASVNFVNQQNEGQLMASDVIGATVYGPDDKSIGDVSDLVTDKDGKVTAAVIGVGGFLGLGQKMVAVNFSSLTQSTQSNGDLKLSISATADQLKNAPDFKTLEDINRARTATTSPSTTGGPATAPAPAR